jgi:hypothetical protein
MRLLPGTPKSIVPPAGTSIHHQQGLLVSTTKVVSFELAQTRYFGAVDYSTREELKSKWYTEEELQESRDEARRCVEALHAAGGKLDHVNPSKFCLRGIEKFANVATKIRARQLLMTSILGQQQQQQQKRRSSMSSSSSSCCSDDPLPETSMRLEEELAALSRYLSQPSRDAAYSLGLWNAHRVHHQDPQDSDHHHHGTVDDDALFLARHEKQEHDAACALLCMSPSSRSTMASTASTIMSADVLQQG